MEESGGTISAQQSKDAVTLSEDRQAHTDSGASETGIMTYRNMGSTLPFPQHRAQTPNSFVFPAQGGLFSTMRTYKKQETLRRTLLVAPLGYSTSGVSSGERSPGVQAPAGWDDRFKQQSSARSSSTNLHPCSSHAAASGSVGSTSALEVPRLSTSPTADSYLDDNPPSVHLGARHEKATLDLSHMLSGQYALSTLLPSSTFHKTPPGVTAQHLTDFGSAQWADDIEISPHVPQAGTESHPEAGFASHPSLSQLLLGDGQTSGSHSHRVAHSSHLSEEERVHQACKRISQALSTRPIEAPQPSMSSVAVEAAECIPEEGGPGGSHTGMSVTREIVLSDADEEACGRPSHGANKEMDDKLMAAYRFQEVSETGSLPQTFKSSLCAYCCDSQDGLQIWDQ